MKTKILLITAVSVIMGCGSLFAFDGRDRKSGSSSIKSPSGMEKHGGMDDNMGIPWERMSDKLGLSEDQKTALKKLDYEKKKNSIQLKSELQVKMLDLGYELREDKINDAKIDVLVNEIGEIQKKMLKSRITSLKNFKSVLTKEQWEQVHKMGPENMENREKRSQKGGRKEKRMD